MTTEQLAIRILDQIDPTFYGNYTIDIHLYGDTYFRADIEVMPDYTPMEYDEETNSYWGGFGDATFNVSNAEIQNAETGENKEYEHTEELETELKKQSKC